MSNYLFVISIVVLFFGCSESDSKEASDSCTFTTKTTKSLRKFFNNHSKASMGEPTCIRSFPDRLEKDSTKTGTRTEIVINEGSFFFEEYTFSKQFLLDHAMEVTFPMALYRDTKREHVSMVDDTLCLVFRADSKAMFETLEPYMTEIEFDYLGIKR